MITQTQAHDLVRDALLRIVPDLDFDTLDEDEDLRDSVELDSLDFLNFVEQLSAGAGRRIEDADTPQLRSISGCVRFLSADTT
jgi:acyl carrier protein